MNTIIRAIAALTAATVTASCAAAPPVTTTTPETAAPSVNPQDNIPLIEFTARTESETGEREYYIFDDNPEHLNPRFLADGEAPSLIAHFENLTPGIYTVFSYHHRGDSCGSRDDLYFDAAFTSADGGEFELLNIGIDKNWDWNQAWADYTGEKVEMPEYISTFFCECADCADHTKGVCEMPDCKARVRGEKRNPKPWDNLNNTIDASGERPALLSELVKRIGDEDINHFRYGGYDEPMWLMMRFRVVSGTVTFDTVAYKSKDAMLSNFKTLKKGPFDNEPQYKGIAENAPEVTAEFSYEITSKTKSGPVPVMVKNMRAPEGYVIEDGTFATNVNTWREEKPIAAESDLMRLVYKDGEKLSQYGKSVAERDEYWRFDAYHTKACVRDVDAETAAALNGYGIKTGDYFVPNSPMSETNHPTGGEASSYDFYKYTACNLGNFGVNNRYIMHISNTSDTTRTFSFRLSSIAGQVYRFLQVSSDGRVVCDKGWTMKKFDSNPAVDPLSTSDPKGRIVPPEYGDTIDFKIAPSSADTITLEIVTLTGCTAPIHNTISVE